MKKVNSEGRSSLGKKYLEKEHKKSNLGSIILGKNCEVVKKRLRNLGQSLPKTTFRESHFKYRLKKEYTILATWTNANLLW